MSSDRAGLLGELARRREVLPPGQRAVDGFPRWGTLLYRPPPAVPADPAIQIIDRLGSYNQHLTSDVGGFYLGFALLFAWTAVTLGRELGRAAAAAFALVQALHLGYHLAHLEPFTVAKGVEEIGGLRPLLALPVLVVILTGTLAPAA